MHDAVSSQVRFGPFAFDVRTGELLKAGTRIKVPDQSVEILRALLERPGDLITHEELRQRLWPENTYGDFEHGLNAAVRRLRDALGDSADAPRFIETLPRRGYRFTESIIASTPVPPVGQAAATREPDTPEGPVSNVPPDARTGGNLRERMAWIFVAVLSVVVIVLGLSVARRARSVESGGDVVRFTIAPPENVTIGSDSSGSGFAVSPDGSHVVFTASEQGVAALWLKPMSGAEPVRLTGTDGAILPFWSPDGRRIGFFATGKLRTIEIGGGPADVICEAQTGRGGTWNERNEIVFAPDVDAALMKVSLSDRRPVAVTTKQEGDTTHRLPAFLPDGRHFFYQAGGGSKPTRVQIASVDSTETEQLPIPDATVASYGAGHVVFLRSGILMAQRFDPSSRRLSGEAFAIAEGEVARFSVSNTGVLGVQAPRESRLTMIDRQGNRSRVLDERTYMVALSPDDGFVATSIRMAPNLGDLYVVDLARRTAQRLTFNLATDFFPVWSPDGQSLAFTSTRGGRSQIFRTSRDTIGKEQLLVDDPSPTRPNVAATDWSRDGRFLAYTKGSNETPSIWILPLTHDAKAFRFRDTPAAMGNAHFSPDSRWLAFTSDESGKQKEVYVAPFPGPGRMQQVSIGGGTQPQWRADGAELFYFAPDGTLMSAAVSSGRDIRTDVPRKLFQVPVNLTVGLGNEYAATKDGQRFLVNVRGPVPPITVAVNSPWTRMTARSQ